MNRIDRKRYYFWIIYLLFVYHDIFPPINYTEYEISVCYSLINYIFLVGDGVIDGFCLPLPATSGFYVIDQPWYPITIKCWKLRFDSENVQKSKALNDFSLTNSNFHSNYQILGGVPWFPHTPIRKMIDLFRYFQHVTF